MLKASLRLQMPILDFRPYLSKKQQRLKTTATPLEVRVWLGSKNDLWSQVSYLSVEDVQGMGMVYRSKISLQDNGYTGIVIAINEDIPENVTLIENIKELFTNASQALYQATRQRAFFKDITILIPRTWSDDIPNEPATTEIFHTANFIVDKPHAMWKQDPYTKQFRPCGEEGEYTHLTDRFLLDLDWTRSKYGDPAKVIVHEWGHLRWGLFDEYATGNDIEYVDEDGYWQATRCSKHVKGNLRCNNGLVVASSPGNQKHCRFEPEFKNNKGTGSYMFISYLDSVAEFCHSDEDGDVYSLHNPMAPNKQNLHCTYKSCWDVMSESNDFRNGLNGPRSGVDTTPTFKVVKSSPLRIVLVLDVSGSMGGTRIQILYQLAAKFIRATVPDNHFVGIVTFHSSATIQSNLIEIVNGTDRENLVEHLPTGTSGTTCIGCGLEDAIQVLEYGGKSARGGIILLITDGGENVDPLMNDVKPRLIEKEIFVDTVSISISGDIKLRNLSQETNGHFYFYSESGGSTALNDALTATISSRLGASSEVAIDLVSDKKTLKSGAITKGFVFIDSTIGKETNFFFLWSSSEVSVSLRSPSGNVTDQSSPFYESDTSAKTVSIKIPGLAEIGEWQYNVTGSGSVEISIQSKARNNTEPISLTTSLTDLSGERPPRMNIFAQVQRGYSPVLEATVTATVERPSPHGPVNVQLRDTGTGLDLTEDDGVYSGLFLDFVSSTCPACRYSIKVKADDNNGVARVSVQTIISGVYPLIPSEQEVTNNTEQTGGFSRVVPGGAIQAPLTIFPGDRSAPSRITDLRVVDTSYDNRIITLSWTAPGNDFDKGTADKYDLRLSHDFISLVKNFTSGEQLTSHNLKVGNLTSPRPFGEKEEVTLQMSEQEGSTTYYFSVKALDTAGNAGEPSNIISTVIADDDSTTVYPVTSQTVTPGTATKGRHTPTEQVVVITSPPSEALSLPIIVGGAVAALVVVTAVVVIVYRVVFARWKKTLLITNNKNVEMDAKIGQENPYVTSA
ncbi:calcium-activated chloride channel regulator 1-like [Glandiceps talaboti]